MVLLLNAWPRLPYSVLRLRTGFDEPAFIAWKLTVSNAIITTIIAAPANSPQCSGER